MSFTRDAEKIDKKGRMTMSVGANIKKRRFAAGFGRCNGI